MSGPTKNRLVLQYAGPVLSRFTCICGRPTFPESIRTPILKATLSPKSQAAQTWEYHLDCVRKVLAGEIVGESSESQPRLRLHSIDEKNKKKCFLTGKSFISGEEVVELSRKKSSRVVLVSRKTLEEILGATPEPVRCSKFLIILDYYYNREGRSLKEITEKAECDEYNILKSFEFISKLIGEIEQCKAELRAMHLSLEDLIALINWMTPRSMEEFLQISFEEYRNSKRALREWLELIANSSMDPFNLLERNLLPARKRPGRLTGSLTSNEKHVLKMEVIRDTKPLQSLGPEIWVTPLFSEIADCLITIPERGLFGNDSSAGVLFLSSKDKTKPLEEADIAEGLVSESVLIRSLCKALHEKRVTKNEE
jgi:hypothetical protein